jgi:hypothetical protein
LSNPLRRLPVRRGEYNARPLDVLAWPIAVGRDRGQLLARRAAHYDAYLLCHSTHLPNAVAQYCIF